jgi:uncharacterized protein YbaP (TraB family)
VAKRWWLTGIAIGIALAGIGLLASLEHEALPEEPGAKVRPEVEALGNKARSTTVRGSSLWKVQKGEATSYLFGTMHTGVAATEIPIRVRFQLQSSRRAYFEQVDFEDAPDSLALPNGRLSELLTPKAFATLRERTRMDPALLDRFSPTGAILILEIMEAGGCLGTGCEAQSLDEQLRNEARKLGIPVAALDSPDVWAKLAPDMEIATSEVEKILADDATFNDMLLQIYRLLIAFKSGDAAGMSSLLLDGSKATRLLVMDRNAAWVDKLAPDLEAGGIFAAFGYAHLLGDEGMPALLRRRGFTVTPE